MLSHMSHFLHTSELNKQCLIKHKSMLGTGSGQKVTTYCNSRHKAKTLGFTFYCRCHLPEAILHMSLVPLVFSVQLFILLSDFANYVYGSFPFNFFFVSIS